MKFLPENRIRAISKYSLIFLAIGMGIACSSGDSEEGKTSNGPEVLDERLQLSLFAEDPDIMTPIGIAVDSLNRIFVLESHTHLEPSDYEGPESDRIKVMTDENNDGKPDSISVFAEGFEDGMNIAFSPDGNLYLVTAREVWAVYDRDEDGKSEGKKKLIEFTSPDYVYDHAGLMGISFSNNGWMYISRGNLGGQGWKLVGTDGSSIAGYGDGGNIVRARPDGSQLQEVATGFWNPFDLKFDDYGRLLVSDNDPDSRGPNRLVHVIEGGDYGYKSLYGNSGIHPYLAWNGELPGTLPYAVGLGEAPSGLLNTSFTSFPQNYKGELLISIWEESSIVRTNLSPRGVSLTGTTEVIVQGGQQFRPVSFAADTSGNVYFTDWVTREYPNHGEGRIWKLANQSNEKMMPRREYASPLSKPEGEPLREIYTYDSPDDFNKLQQALTSEDPFLRNGAISMLANPIFEAQLVEASRSDDADVRLGAMIALHRSGYEDAEPIARRLLADEDLRIRRYALKWIGRTGMSKLISDIERALTAGQPTEGLLKTYLATVRHLQPEFIEAYRNQAKGEAKQIDRELPPGFIEDFIREESRPVELRAMAIKYLENPGDNIEFLISLMTKDQDMQLRMEAVRTLAMNPSKQAAKPLLNIAQDDNNSTQLRAEALAGLERQPNDVSGEVMTLLDDSETDIQIEAARYLRTRLSSEGVEQALREQYRTTDSEPLKRQIAMALTDEQLEGTRPRRPSSPEEWQAVLAEGNGGDPIRGRRVFYSVHSTCASCHAVDERGGDLGPDLSNAGQSKTRSQLVHSILRPSDEISPQWQGWYIELKDGTTHRGRQINVGSDDIEIYTQEGEVANFNKEDVQDYGVAETSLMPPNLQSRLTISDMRDLVSYLKDEK